MATNMYEEHVPVTDSQIIKEAVNEGDETQDQSCNAKTFKGKPWIDRGWAWVVAFGGLLVMYAAIGQMRCMGLYFAELQKLFNQSSAVAAMLPSILFSIAPIMCVISSALASWCGARPIIIGGVLLAVLAHTLVMFAANITQFLIFYSVPVGIGIGLIYTPSQILVAQYFIKNSSLAQGILNTGSSLAGISLPPLFSYLSEIYGFRGTMLILGGIIANTLVAASLFRPIGFWDRKKHKPLEEDWTLSNIKNGPEQRERFESIVTGKNNEQESSKRLANSTSDSHEWLNGRNGEARNREKADTTLLALQTNTAPKWTTVSPSRSTESIHYETTYQQATTGSMILKGQVLSVSQQDLEQIQQQRLDDAIETSRMSGRFQRCCHSVNKAFNFSLLKNPAFVVHTFTSCSGFVVYMLMSTILPSHAIDLGITPSKSYSLISIGAVVEVPSRLIVTILADRWATTNYGRRFHIMSLSLLVSGIVGFLTSYSTTFLELAVCFSIHSFFMGGGFLALNVDVLREAIGLKNLTNGGLGLSLLFTGLTNGLFPILFGAMRDEYGDYIGALDILGTVALLGALTIWLQLVISRKKEVVMIPQEDMDV